MNRTEAVLLCRYVKAACPQQAIDQYTPDAWGDLLAGVAFEDAKTAAQNLCKRQPFVAPAEICAEVGRIRQDRDMRFNYEPPSDLPSCGHYDDESWQESAKAEMQYRNIVGELVRDGLLAPGDPQPSYTDLAPLIEDRQREKAAKALEAREARQDALDGRLKRLASSLTLTSD